MLHKHKEKLEREKKLIFPWRFLQASSSKDIWNQETEFRKENDRN